MRQDFYFSSKGKGKIHAIRWTPNGKIRGIVQIVHGIADYAERYGPFADYLNNLGFVVTGEDHMGHGQSIEGGSTRGYFHGGWFAAIADTCQLMKDTMAEYPNLPYVLFGHSMGSFMARTILCSQPDSGIAAAVICGTCWQPKPLLPPVIGMCKVVCRITGEEVPSEFLQSLAFGSYNKKIDHPHTPYDWISRDEKIVNDYNADPLCGFTPCAGLLRDMMIGLNYAETENNLSCMRKDLPVLIIGGEADPVGLYGKSVPAAAAAFRKAGVLDVSQKLYSGARHEILNEINRDEVFADISSWIESKVFQN